MEKQTSEMIFLLLRRRFPRMPDFKIREMTEKVQDRRPLYLRDIPAAGFAEKPEPTTKQAANKS